MLLGYTMLQHNQKNVMILDAQWQRAESRKYFQVNTWLVLFS